jgi:hypothetical protein
LLSCLLCWLLIIVHAYTIVFCGINIDLRIFHIVIVNDQCFVSAVIWVFHYHLNQDPVILPLEDTSFCFADRRSATSASSSRTRALASSRYLSCARVSRVRCNPCKDQKSSAKNAKGVQGILLTRHTAEPKRATGTMPGTRSEYHCAWADLPEVADWLYVRHRGLTDIVRCHVARSMGMGRLAGIRCLNNRLARDNWADERTRVG